MLAISSSCINTMACKQKELQSEKCRQSKSLHQCEFQRISGPTTRVTKAQLLTLICIVSLHSGESLQVPCLPGATSHSLASLITMLKCLGALCLGTSLVVQEHSATGTWSHLLALPSQTSLSSSGLTEMGLLDILVASEEPVEVIKQRSGGAIRGCSEKGEEFEDPWGWIQNGLEHVGL